VLQLRQGLLQPFYAVQRVIELLDFDSHECAAEPLRVHRIGSTQFLQMVVQIMPVIPKVSNFGNEISKELLVNSGEGFFLTVMQTLKGRRNGREE
jgi:hypothetical protein